MEEVISSVMGSVFAVDLVVLPLSLLLLLLGDQLLPYPLSFLLKSILSPF